MYKEAPMRAKTWNLINIFLIGFVAALYWVDGFELIIYGFIVYGCIYGLIAYFFIPTKTIEFS